jgi:hypothetical protein
MKGTRHLGAFGILFLILASAAPARALPPFAEYGPACQWVRLFGELKKPSAIAKDEPLLLTITYKLPHHKGPYTLVTNRPMKEEKFVFVLSGFREPIDGVFYVEPGFFFAKKIKFQYYAASQDRKWKSEWQSSVYLPERVKKEGKIYCKTAIQLEPMKLEVAP